MKRNLLIGLTLALACACPAPADSPERERAAAYASALGAAELPPGDLSPEFVWWLKLASDLKAVPQIDAAQQRKALVTNAVVLALNPNLQVMQAVELKAQTLAEIQSDAEVWRLFMNDLKQGISTHPLYAIAAFSLCNNPRYRHFIPEDLRTDEELAALLQAGIAAGDECSLLAEAYNKTWGFCGGRDSAAALRDISRSVANSLLLGHEVHRSSMTMLAGICRDSKDLNPLRVVAGLEGVAEAGQANPTAVHSYACAVLDVDPESRFAEMRWHLVLPYLLNPQARALSQELPAILHLAAEGLKATDDGDRAKAEAKKLAKQAKKAGYVADKDYLQPALPAYTFLGGFRLNFERMGKEERRYLRPLLIGITAKLADVQNEGARAFLFNWVGQLREDLSEVPDRTMYERLFSSWEFSAKKAAADAKKKPSPKPGKAAQPGEFEFRLYKLHATGYGRSHAGMDEMKAMEYLRRSCEAGFAPARLARIQEQLDLGVSPSPAMVTELQKLVPDATAAFLLYRALKDAAPDEAELALKLSMRSMGYEAWALMRDRLVADEADIHERVLAAAFAAHATGASGKDWMALDRELQVFAEEKPDAREIVNILRMIVLDNACLSDDCHAEAAELLKRLARGYLSDSAFADLERRMDALKPGCAE